MTSLLQVQRRPTKGRDTHKKMKKLRDASEAQATVWCVDQQRVTMQSELEIIISITAKIKEKHTTGTFRTYLSMGTLQT